MLQLSLNALYAGCHGSTVCLYSESKGIVEGTCSNAFQYACLLKMMLDEVGLHDVVYVSKMYTVHITHT